MGVDDGKGIQELHNHPVGSLGERTQALVREQSLRKNLLSSIAYNCGSSNGCKSLSLPLVRDSVSLLSEARWIISSLEDVIVIYDDV